MPNYDLKGAETKWKALVSAGPIVHAGNTLTLEQPNDSLYWDFSVKSSKGADIFRGHLSMLSMDDCHHVTLLKGSATGKKTNYHFTFDGNGKIDPKKKGKCKTNPDGTHEMLQSLPGDLKDMLMPVLNQVLEKYCY